MHSSATEIEFAPNDETSPSTPHTSGERTPSYRSDVASGEIDQDHFSPDQYQTTDRYRLVTPYQLLSNQNRSRF